MSDQPQDKKQNTKPVPSVPSPSETPKGIPKDATVLVVEDQAQVRELVRFILESAGYGVLDDPTMPIVGSSSGPA